jgi:hypothetical protein
MGIEGGQAVEDRRRLVRDFYQPNIRCMTLTHSNTNKPRNSDRFQLRFHSQKAAEAAANTAAHECGLEIRSRSARASLAQRGTFSEISGRP